MDLISLLFTAFTATAGAVVYRLLDGKRPRWLAASAAAACAVCVGASLWWASTSSTAEITALAVCFSAAAAGVAYALVRQDVSPRRAVSLAAASAVIVGLGFLITLYLAPVAFLVAAVVYRGASRVYRVNHALVASAVTLSGLLAAFGAAFYIAVGSMS